MKGFSSYPKLNWIAIALTCIVFFLNIPASKAQTSEDLPYGYKAIWFDSSSGSKGNEDAPDKFMSESNASIIANVKELECNTVFLNVSLLKINPFQTANDTNLGLDLTYYPGYKIKLTNFLDSCANEGIKVFAVPSIENHFIMPDYQDSALMKISHLCYYQNNVRKNGSPYASKKAHFQGMVLNIEPWSLNDTIYGTIYNWNANGSICTASGRTHMNSYLGHYLNLISDIYNTAYIGSFFSPQVAIGQTLQQLDNLFLGTVHWVWHYFSQIHKANTFDFPNGDYSLFVGERNGKHYYDFILPETYCAKTGATCISNPCIDNNLEEMCANPNNYQEVESIGRCWQWFRKHFLTTEMYENQQFVTRPIVTPIDAAPMLFGHSAYMFNDFEDLDCLRDISGYVSLSCYRKENYHGSFIYDYHEAVSLSSGLCQIGITCTPTPPPTESASDSLSSARVITAYPNPASEELSITGLFTNEKIQVFNFSNQLLVESSTSPINIAHLPEGFYILRITDELGVVVYNSTISINR